ncbi:DUF4336 domain-containing protein [Nostoc ellipsosporum NOK]|nr:DUF4336 domain-containing protein [Nostoc ellipsosporum NOK]
MEAMLRPFGTEIWLADGPVVSVAGFRYPTRMAVMRLRDGTLFLWSPIALSDGLRGAVAALGAVRHLIAPNGLHDRFLGEWQRAFPQATLHAPPGLATRHPDLRFGRDLADGPGFAWDDEIDQITLSGNRITTELAFFHHASRTLLFTDLIQHFPRGWFAGWRAIVARLDGMTAREPQVPRKFRYAFSDRPAARLAVRRILDWPAEKLVIAHGPPVERDARAVVANAFRWLGA